MLSSAKIGTASWRYYTAGVACAATEYYLGIGEAPGRWHGRGLAELGLEPGAVVTEAQLEALFARGAAPGDRAAAGPGLAGRWGDRVRLDVLGAEERQFPVGTGKSGDRGGRDERAPRCGYRAGLPISMPMPGCRGAALTGPNRSPRQGLAVALFDHRTSRCGDPQLHTHALVINKVRCADGVWRTLDATELYHHKKSAGMIYQAALRNELTERLGVEFEHGE